MKTDKNRKKISRFQVKGFPRITIDPNQMGGAPCIRHIRVPVSTIMRMLANGMSTQQVIAELPYIEEEDIVEALLFAAESLERSRELTHSK